MELDSPEDSSPPRTKEAIDIDVETENGPWLQTNTASWWHAANGEVRVWVPVLIGVLVFAALVISRIAGFGIAQTTKTDKGVVAMPNAIATPAISTGDVEAGSKTAVSPRAKLSADGGSSIVPAPANATSRSAGAPKSNSNSLTGRALLTVDSNPAGADVEIDGRFVGNAPSAVSITLGSHQIYVEKRGYLSWNKTLTVTGGKIHLNADLEQVPAGQ